MNINSTRAVLYKLARGLGDLNAVSTGTVARRVARRVAGRVAGRLLRRLLP